METSKLPSLYKYVFPYMNGASLVKLDQSQWSSNLKGMEQCSTLDRILFVYRVDINENIKEESLFDRLIKATSDGNFNYMFEFAEEEGKYLQAFAGYFLSYYEEDGDIYPFTDDSLIIEGHSMLNSNEDLKIGTLYPHDEDSDEDIYFYCKFLCKGKNLCYMVVMSGENDSCIE